MVRTLRRPIPITRCCSRLFASSSSSKVVPTSFSFTHVKMGDGEVPVFNYCFLHVKVFARVWILRRQTLRWAFEKENNRTNWHGINVCYTFHYLQYLVEHSHHSHLSGLYFTLKSFHLLFLSLQCVRNFLRPSKRQSASKNSSMKEQMEYDSTQSQETLLTPRGEFKSFYCIWHFAPFLLSLLFWDGSRLLVVHSTQIIISSLLSLVSCGVFQFNFSMLYSDIIYVNLTHWSIIRKPITPFSREE